MQSVFGPEAGGRDGIAGSPRGQKGAPEDLVKVAHAVNTKYIEKQIAQETSLDDAKSVDTSNLTIKIFETKGITPTDDLNILAGQLDAKYLINNGAIGCEASVEGIKMYMKAVQEMTADISPSLSVAVTHDAQTVIESVAKVEARDQKVDFAKDICTKVISESKRQVEEFKKMRST